MTRRIRDREHERARELAATRVGEALDPTDAGWLETHLAWCAPCRAVAGEYASQRLELRALRLEHPVPPRDLWARTSSALDVEQGKRGIRTERATGRTSSRVRSRSRDSLPLGALTGALAVVFVIGATILSGQQIKQPLLDGSPQAPSVETAMVTPFPVQRSYQVVVGAGSAFEITTSNISEVCPIDAIATCSSARITRGRDVDVPTSDVREAVISPTKSHVVIQTATSVVVVPMITASPIDATPSPTGSAAGSPAPTPSGSPDATATPDPSAGATPEATPSATPEATPSDAPPTDAPPTDAPPTDAPPSDTATASPSADATEPPPSLDVTPDPSSGALTIAAKVIVVGRSAAYSRDGSAFAFTARPSDGSQGPDVYVWRAGTSTALPVTTDHASIFSDWIDGRILLSRADKDGDPLTAARGDVPVSILLDPVTGEEQVVSDAPMFRPTVSPTGRTAVWWEGAIEPGAEGFGWQPRSGRLLLGTWRLPGVDATDDPGTPSSAPDVLASGPVPDWDARWDETGTRLAVWIADRTDPSVGKLSLYGIDATTGRIDTANVVLDGATAAPGFAIGSGRLVWAVRDADNGTRVEVLAWTANGVGQVEMVPSDLPLVVVR